MKTPVQLLRLCGEDGSKITNEEFARAWFLYYRANKMKGRYLTMPLALSMMLLIFTAKVISSLAGFSIVLFSLACACCLTLTLRAYTLEKCSITRRRDYYNWINLLTKRINGQYYIPTEDKDLNE